MQVVSSGLKLEKGPAHHKSTTGFLSPGPPDGPWPGLCETLCLQCGIVAQNYTAGAKTPKTDCQPHPWSQIQVPPFSHCSSDLAGGCSVCRAPLGSLGLGPALSPGLGGLESNWAGVGSTEGSHVVTMWPCVWYPFASRRTFFLFDDEPYCLPSLLLQLQTCGFVFLVPFCFNDLPSWLCNWAAVGTTTPPSDRIPCRCHVALCTAPPGLPSLLPQLQTHCPAFLPHALSAGEQNTWGHMWCNATHSGAVWCSVVHFTTLGPGLASLCCSQTRNSPCCWAAGDPTCLYLACWGKSRWAKRAGQHHPPLGTLRTRPCILCNVVQCGASDATSSCCVAKGVLTALQQAGTTADVCDLVWWCKVSPVGLKNCVRRSVQA